MPSGPALHRRGRRSEGKQGILRQLRCDRRPSRSCGFPGNPSNGNAWNTAKGCRVWWDPCRPRARHTNSWPEVQDKMVDSMVRLHAALKPPIARLWGPLRHREFVQAPSRIQGGALWVHLAIDSRNRWRSLKFEGCDVFYDHGNPSESNVPVGLDSIREGL